jgi:1,2-diacylglycerol 3-beta-glucosyltransferase
MVARLLAVGLLAFAGIISWLAVTNALVARLLQAAIGGSMVYVAYLAFRGWRWMVRARLADARATADVAAAAGLLGAEGAPAEEVPFVSVVVPARNEAPVIGDIVGDLCRQAYPAGGAVPRYEVVIVDDGSTDGSGDLARAAARAAGAAQVRVLHRSPGDAPRTKGAVLAWVQPQVRGDVVAVLDADARVGPDYLARVMRAWSATPDAVAVQSSRWPTNTGAGWLASAQLEELLMDLASQCGRWVTDGTAELRGNGMFVRCAELDQAGGWNPAAITEDLELSTRLAATGARVALAPAVHVGEEAVLHWGDLWRQRLRWAEGSMRRLIEQGPHLLRQPLPIKRKLDFLMFTTEFAIPPLFVTGVIVGLLTMPQPTPTDWTVPISLFLGYGTGTFLLAAAGLAAHGVRGVALPARAARGALFLSHWLLVVPAALVRIAVGPRTEDFVQTPRLGHRQGAGSRR